MSAARAGLTADEAAVYANRAPDTIRKACAVGDLHGVQRKVRGPWTIKAECIDSYLAGEACEHRRGNVVQLSSRRGA